MDADASRLPVEPGVGRLVRGKAVTFTVDGRSVRAFEGESVAAAMYANDRLVLSRSIKYHRPRGLWCGVGKCANCFMRVEGQPNVRTCIMPVREGLVCESQNALPSARRDLLAVIDKVYRKDFDYHDKFIRPGFLRPVYHKVIRRMAGFGEIPDRSERAPVDAPPVRALEVDVAVVGAGAAGLAAAHAAAEAGARVALFEELDAFGGELLLDDRALPPAAGDVAGLSGSQAAGHLLEALAGNARVEERTRAAAVGIYPDAGLVVMDAEGLTEVKHKALVVAVGSYDVLPVFEGNDLPGILTARAALRLLLRHGIRPGEAIVVAGATDRAALLVDALARHGVPVEAVVDDGHHAEVPEVNRPRFRHATLRRAKGGTRIESLVIDTHESQELEIPCDCLVLAHPPVARPELLQQAGCELADDPVTGAFVPVVTEDLETTVEGVFVAGGALSPTPPVLSLLEGRLAGAAAAARAGHGDGRRVAAARDALAKARTALTEREVSA